MGEEIGFLAFGEAEAELENLGALPVLPGIVRAYQVAWACLFRLYAGDVIWRRETAGGAAQRIATKAFFRDPLAKEMIAGVMVSDQTIIVDPVPLIAGGLSWPPRQGDKIVRFPGLATASMFTSFSIPTVIDVAGSPLAVRLIGRGV